MQVWDAKNKEYIFQDKYYGRELRVGKDFQMALTGYITSTSGGDSHVLTHHIPTILSKIRQLGTLSPLLLQLSPTSLKLQSNVCGRSNCQDDPTVSVIRNIVTIFI